MVRWSTYLVAALAVVTPARAGAELEYRGVALGLWHLEEGTSYAPQLQEIRSVHANAVLLPVLTFVDTVNGTGIYRLDGRTAPDALLERTIADAHRAGLQVALMPIVRIENRVDREWRGQLAPPDRDAFFASYRNMVVHYAKLAQENRVQLFLMGSELASLEDAPHWLPLIERLREVYHGTLSYSANWDHYESVPFWEQLDALALTGYYELSRTFEPTQELLDGSWRWVRNRIAEWRTQYPGKRVIFTEVGYPAQDGCSVTPWDYTLRNPVDLEEQRMCYEAFVNVWRGDPALGGVFFWEWNGPGGFADDGYTPRGKPAAAVLKAYFAADAGTPVSVSRR